MRFLREWRWQAIGAGNAFYRALRIYWANGSLLAWARVFQSRFRAIRGLPGPRSFHIAPTYRCQCHCVHCYAHGRGVDPAEEMETAEIKRVIDEVRRLGCLQVVFTGGEPLLREDIVECVGYAHRAGLITCVNTNGLLLDVECVSELKKAGLTQCGVSIDDADPDTHDRLRGVPGCYHKAVAGIENLHRAGILCQILTYAPRRNVTAGLARIVALGRELGVLSVYILPPMAAGRWDGRSDQVLTDEEKAKVRDLQDVALVHFELAGSRSMCGICKGRSLLLSPVGDVTPCPAVPYVMGNIRDHSLTDIWRLHLAQKDFQWRGFCPMNDAESRDALKRHVESVSRLLT
ncbi:MAG: radical SAM protein [Planctomycetes bacterium]|nr:radical SAM protein [Planctomycetota bacterium]